MNTTISANRSGGPSTTVSDVPWMIRKYSTFEAAALQTFASSPGAHFVCHQRAGRCGGGLGSPRHLTPFVVGASNPGGSIEGGAWVEEDADEALLVVVVQAALQRTELAALLIAAAAQEARSRGIRRLAGLVTKEAHDPFDDFRAAGVRVESAIALGGSTKVMLALD